TLLGMLLVIGVMGAGLAAYGQIASHAAQREKEAELIFRGRQYREAIESYYRKEQTYPSSLGELLSDNRYPSAVRHLRRLYADPITGKAQWGLMQTPDGNGIMGVYSTSEQAPIKTGNFGRANQHFAEAKSYKDWQFFHSPAGAPPAR
ncbi:MAG TPA: type II secretion system protein, partial [Burkholderiales bacterium]